MPAHVTVITRDEIESSGARTLQDLLTLEAGVVVFDQIGNDIQKSFDLRGFGAERTGATRVLPRRRADQRAAQQLGAARAGAALRRSTASRSRAGRSAALAGGGSEAGAINLWTRRGAESGASISAAAGDFATQEGRASAWHDFGAGDLFLVGRTEETDGFRDNADGDLDRFQGSLGWDLGARAAALALAARQQRRLRQPRRAHARRDRGGHASRRRSTSSTSSTRTCARAR